MRMRSILCLVVLCLTAGVATAGEIDALTVSLKSTDPTVQRAALERLRQWGSDAVAAADATAGLIASSDPEVRRSALETLAAMPACTDPILRSTATAVRDENVNVRIAALQMLGACGPDAAHEIDPVVRALVDSEVREYAVATLGSFGKGGLPALSKLLALTNDSDRLLRQEAIRAVARMTGLVEVSGAREPNADISAIELSEAQQLAAALAIVEQLRSPDGYTRQVAIESLNAARGDLLSDERIVALIVRVPSDADEMIRAAAIKPLYHIALANRADDASPTLFLTVAEALARLTRDPASSVRIAALSAAGSLPMSDGLAELLASSLDDVSEPMRLKAAEIIASDYTGLAASIAVEQLITRVTADPSPSVRIAAVSGLKNVAKEDPQAVWEAIHLAAKDPNSQVRAGAAPAISAALHSDYVLARAEANEDLAATEEESGQAEEKLDVLYTLLRDEDHVVRAAAAEALEEISPFSEPRLEALKSALHDRRAEIRRTAATIAGNFGPRAQQLTPRVLEMLRDVSESVRVAAATNVRYLGGESTAIIRALMPLVAGEPGDGRDAAVETIGWLGQDAAPVAPAIAKTITDDASSDSDKYVMLAGTALGRIGPAGIAALEEEEKRHQEDRAKETEQREASGKKLTGFAAALATIDVDGSNLRRALEQAKKAAATRTYRVARADGTPIVLTATRRNPVVLLATWCGYSDHWKRTVTDPIMKPFLSSAKIQPVFTDEWGQVRAALGERGVPTAELDARVAAMKAERNGSRLYDPEFASTFDGVYYLIDIPERVSFPSMVDVETGGFSGAYGELPDVPIPDRVRYLARDLAEKK